MLKLILNTPLKGKREPMRAIDADDLKTAFPVCDNSKSVLIASVRATINHMPTIEPERKTGRWIEQEDVWDVYYECSACGEPWDNRMKFCPNCGADMRTPVEIARDIVHEAIDNSAWSDTVDIAKMHKVVDDKYAEMTKKTEEPKKCDTCKHVKSQWFNRCADCSDYELWESKE